MSDNTLKPITALDAVRARYENATAVEKVNALVLGNIGCGKTSSLATLPGPILIHSFDPNGSVVLRLTKKADIESGRIIIDTQFEEDSVKEPVAVKKWQMEMARLEKEKVFDKLGSYVIDSGTVFVQALINMILSNAPTNGTPRKKNPFGLPQMEITDWGTLLTYFRDAMKECCNLPCNFVLTGHLGTDKDETTGQILEGFAIPGRSREQVPIIFDELYIAEARQTSTGLQYVFLTQREGRSVARTRLGAGGKLAKYEPQDFKQILEKVGFNAEDKV